MVGKVRTDGCFGEYLGNDLLSEKNKSSKNCTITNSVKIASELF